MYVETVDEVGGDVVEDLTEVKVVAADELGGDVAEVPTEKIVVTADELGFEEVAERKDENVEDAAVVDDADFELEADETPD